MQGYTDQQKGTSASLKDTWVLAQHHRSLSDTKVLVSLVVTETVVEDLATDKLKDCIIVLGENCYICYI